MPRSTHGCLNSAQTYEVLPTSEHPGRVRIETPGGRVMYPDEAGASEEISAVIGQPLRLERAQPQRRERTGIDPATVFGDVPVEELKPGFTAQTLTDYFELMEGRFFEVAALHVLASASVEHLRRLQPGAAIDRRRFRPNLYIETGAEWTGFVEDAWLGGTLAVGAALRIDGMQPALGCVTTTLAQGDLPRDLSVLRTSAETPCGLRRRLRRGPGPRRFGPNWRIRIAEQVKAASRSPAVWNAFLADLQQRCDGLWANPGR